MRDTTPDSTLRQQIDQLARLTQQIQGLLARVEATIPSHLLEHVSDLQNSLSHLSHRASLLEKSRADLLALVDISQVINSTLETEEVLRTVMDTIIRLTSAERGFLMLKNKRGELETVIARNWEQESIDPSEFAISHTVINRVIREGQPVLTTNAQADPRFGRQQSVLAYNLLSILCVPLKVKDEITGVIYADNRIHSGIFTEHELELLTAFANQAAVAIENARLFEAQRCTLAEVTELKNLMDNVFSSIASGVITTDAEEKITMCNRAAEQILGLRRSDVIGHRLKEALPQLSQSLSGYMQSVWRNGRDWTGIELEIIPSHGGSLYLSLNLSPLKDAAQATQGIAIVIDDLTEKKRLEAQHRLFERMVSPSVIEQLNPDKLQLGGKRAEITTLFADIRGFTGLGERVPPEVLVSVLNLYLAAAAEAILAHQGTIDKFLGDAILAWFNAPIPQPDHALRAVLAALDLHKAVLRIQKDLPPEFRLSFGAGIHSGEAVLGLVGTQKRLEYTAIGDSVNIAKRIQESTAPGQILISADTHRLLGDQVEARPVQVPIVKGKNRSIQAYEVLGIKNVL